MFQQGPGCGDPGPRWGGPGATRCTNSPVTQNHTRRERAVSPASGHVPRLQGGNWAVAVTKGGFTQVCGGWAGRPLPAPPEA